MPAFTGMTGGASRKPRSVSGELHNTSLIKLPDVEMKYFVKGSVKT